MRRRPKRPAELENTQRRDEVEHPDARQYAHQPGAGGRTEDDNRSGGHPVVEGFVVHIPQREVECRAHERGQSSGGNRGWNRDLQVTAEDQNHHGINSELNADADHGRDSAADQAGSEAGPDGVPRGLALQTADLTVLGQSQQAEAHPEAREEKLHQARRQLRTNQEGSRQEAQHRTRRTAGQQPKGQGDAPSDQENHSRRHTQSLNDQAEVTGVGRSLSENHHEDGEGHRSSTHGS